LALFAIYIEDVFPLTPISCCRWRSPDT